MDDDALGCLLILALVAAPFVAIYGLYRVIWWAVENPEEFFRMMQGFLIGLIGLLCWPQLVVAGLFVWLVRDVIVKAWPLTDNGEWVRRVVVVWFTLSPILFGGMWLSAMVSVVHMDTWGLGGMFLPVISALAAIGCYFYVYFENVPKHPNWPKFLAAEYELRFDFRLWYIEQKTRWRL